MRIKDYEYCVEEGLLFPYDLLEDKNSFYREKFKKKFLIENFIPEYSGSTIKNIIRQLSDISSLVFEDTQDCNLACKYCFYSGIYKDQRNKTRKTMSVDMGIRTIDFFFNWVIKQYKFRKTPMSFTIAFYGGEPTLNFDLIKDIVAYSKSLIRNKDVLFKCGTNLMFHIVTNGIDVMKNIEFFVDNNFYLTISIDGPENINDKNRGKGSFSKTYSLVKYLFKHHQSFYKNNVKYNVVFVPGTDLEEIVNFFCQDIFDKSLDITLLHINPLGLLKSKSEYKIDGYNKIFNQINLKIKKGEKLKKIEKAIISRFFESEFNNLKNFSGRVPGAWCTPGSVMLFVTCDGDFYGCEKVSRSFKIGNINNGFNFEYIKKLNNAWFKNYKYCNDCFAKSSCAACLAKIGLLGNIDRKRYCNDYKKKFLKRIEKYIELYECK